MDRALYVDHSNTPHLKRMPFKFLVDAANAPTLSPSPLNSYITSVARISQGLFRLTLADGFRIHVATDCTLNVNAAGVQRWAQPGPVANVGTVGPVTVDILIVDNAGAVQDPPAANANNFVSGEILFCDTTGI